MELDIKFKKYLKQCIKECINEIFAEKYVEKVIKEHAFSLLKEQGSNRNILEEVKDGTGAISQERERNNLSKKNVNENKEVLRKDILKKMGLDPSDPMYELMADSADKALNENVNNGVSEKTLDELGIYNKQWDKYL